MLKYIVSFIPLLAGICVFSTMGLCYFLTYPTLGKGMIFPAVSALGIEQPQKLVYQIGFSTTGFLFGLCIYLFSIYTQPILLKELVDPNDKKKFTYSSILW